MIREIFTTLKEPETLHLAPALKNSSNLRNSIVTFLRNSLTNRKVCFHLASRYIRSSLLSGSRRGLTVVDAAIAKIRARIVQSSASEWIKRPIWFVCQRA